MFRLSININWYTITFYDQCNYCIKINIAKFSHKIVKVIQMIENTMSRSWWICLIKKLYHRTLNYIIWQVNKHFFNPFYQQSVILRSKCLISRIAKETPCSIVAELGRCCTLLRCVDLPLCWARLGPQYQIQQ